MKILFVHKSYYPAVREGGDTLVLYDVATELARMGQDVTVYATNANADQDLGPEYIGPRVIQGVKVHFFPRSTQWIGRRWYFAHGFAAHLRSHMHDFDIVHIWHIFGYMTTLTASIARLAGMKYVVSPQANLSPVALRKNRFVKLVYLHLVERMTFRGAAGVQCNTRFDAEWAASVGIPQFKLLPNVTYGIRDMPAHEQAMKRDRGRYFVFVGRIDPIKGLDFFLRVLALLVHRDKIDCRLVIVGPTSQGYGTEFAGLVQAGDLTGHVDCRGYVDETEKRHLIEHALCLVLPSYTESFGLVVAEAMAIGTPVVISDQCNVREHVEKADCGFVIPHDANLWARKIKKLMEDSSLLSELGQRGFAYFKAHLTVARCAAGLLRNYQMLRIEADTDV